MTATISPQTGPIPRARKDIVDYALQDTSQLLKETRCALLLVDVQNRFIYPDGRTNTVGASVVEPISRLLTTARELDIPRVYVTIGKLPEGVLGDSPSWVRRLSDIVGEGARESLGREHDAFAHEIPEPIAPKCEPLFHKYRYSAFLRTGLETYLNSIGVETVVIGGVASYGCIVNTAIDASCRGFFSIVPKEATAGVNPDLHDAAMKMIGAHSITDVDTVIASWTAAAG
jgi:nicotinamidase-related amidase